MTGQADAALRHAVEMGDVPGVVARAVSGGDLLYQGAFGTQNLAGPAMALDTVFRVASMTKLVTSVAAMQLVEQGRLGLDDPVPAIDPALSAPQVLEGFDPSGAPQLRPARTPITLRHLLTHTAGFTYGWCNANMARYLEAGHMPAMSTGTVASLRMPLAFDPGERWAYGINTDWVGRIIEAVSGQALDAYFQDHIFGPLGMVDTGFTTTPDQRARQASVHQRMADGSLQPQPFEKPFTPEFRSGGAGLYSTAGDMLALLEALLPAVNAAPMLRPETVLQMGQNQIGALEAGVITTTDPAHSLDINLFPGASLKWGLGAMLTPQPGPNGRSAGSLTWAGIFNTHYWLDPARRIAGVLMTQVLPFGDARAMALYGQFERSVYDRA